jgi:ribonuclease HI
MEPRETIQYSKDIFTDESKTGEKIGAGAAIYVDQELIKPCKYKLGSSSTNDQAEQLAILKSLEELSFFPEHKDRMLTVYTDSQVTLYSLRNNSIHAPTFADIQKKVQQLTTQNWTIHCGWIKSHTEIEGNELADRLAKQVAAEAVELKVLYEKTTKVQLPKVKKGRNSKVAETMGKNKQRCSVQVVPPVRRAKTTSLFTYLA